MSVEVDIGGTLEAQAQMVAALRQEAEANLVDEMGQLHNQFVAFISAANIPLPQVALVLDLLKQETLNQAFSQYLGEEHGN